MLWNVGGLKKKFYLHHTTLNELLDSFAGDKSRTSLDIGSGPAPKNPFNAGIVYGADLRENQSKNVVYANLSSGMLPFENEMFDYVTAYDALEHIQRVVMIEGETRFPFILLINEIFRILKPGGIFFSIQPCYPAKQAFQDPTHVNIMTEDTMSLYFCEPAWARIYGYDGSFEMIKDGWIGDKYFSFMKKAAAYPIKDLEFVQQ